MKLTEEQRQKMNTAKSAEELIALARAEGIPAADEEIKAQFKAMHKKGELSDDELNNVAGGCGISEYLDGYKRPREVSPRAVDLGAGNWEYYCPSCGKKLNFVDLLWDSNDDGTCHYPYYLFNCESGHTFRNYYCDDQWTENA